MTYRGVFGSRQTPQSQPIPGRTDMARNEAGGYGWQVTDKQRLDRFLILGSEKPTYYVSQQALTMQNAEAVLREVQRNGEQVVGHVREISLSGRAPKNGPALFVLALCAGLGSSETRAAAYKALPDVARIPTHLFEFLGYVQEHRGWGRGLRQAVAYWYTNKASEALAYQMVKYRQRDGWTHADVLRLAHPKPWDVDHNRLYKWATKGMEEITEYPESPAMRLVWAYEKAQRAQSEAEVVALISQHGLPWEAIDTKWLGSAAVWAALLPGLPMTAMIRNLGRMTANKLIGPFSEAERTVVAKLADAEVLRKARVHPIQVLAALCTYQQGHGMRGGLTWLPSRKIVDALDGAFYGSFGNVRATGKRLVLAIDISGSMGAGEIAGVPGLTPRMAAAAMALVTANVEGDYQCLAFSDHLVPLTISPRERLDDVARRMAAIEMGGTDCSLPMLWALGQGVVRASWYDKPTVTKGGQVVPGIDGFIVYTDNETWAGAIHPCQALQQYREVGASPRAKLVTVGMTSEGFSIADAKDAGMLDVVGFDTAAPNLIGGFISEQKEAIPESEQ